MKKLKLLGLALFAVVALLAVVGLLLPGQWQVEVRTTVTAAPEHVFPLVQDFRRWPEWAAWNQGMDPEVKWTYSGAESGVGASWAWAGPKMGKGAMTITRADPAAGIWVEEKIESDEVNAHGSITWTVEGEKLHLVWKDVGTLPPVFGPYFKGMLEKMLGDHFQKGLEKLGTAAAAETVKAAATQKAAAEAAPSEAAPTEAAPAEQTGTATAPAP